MFSAFQNLPSSFFAPVNYSPPTNEQKQSGTLDAFVSGTTRLTPLALRYIHTFVPLMPLHEVTSMVALCDRSSNTLHGSFLLNALYALTDVITPPSPPHTNHYLKAKNQAMPAYFNALSPSSPSPTPSQPGSHVITVCALLYMTLHQIFTVGWASSAATYLHLAEDIIARVPESDASRRRWLARIAWLYERALEELGAVPDGMDCFRNSHPQLLASCLGLGTGLDLGDGPLDPVSVLEQDDAMRGVDALVDLCLELESVTAEATKGKDVASLGVTELNQLTLSLSQRAGQWMKSNPGTHDAVLQLNADGEHHIGGDEDQVQEVSSRLFLLVYHSMMLKFLTMDDTRCSIKRTSFFVAITKIVDAADYLITSKRTWLWPFIEPALDIARGILVSRATYSHTEHISKDGRGQRDASPVEGERSLLVLIKDVYGAALHAMDAESPQRAVAERALESIATALG
ncbi:hypothetical protein BXZ70DRAFT_899027 [Cristinia sonorae]|uniref:Uncharacterized protein n=1 Tax=Cristinia sonorae TaxID=1940300 RepID=A0A8K0UGP1_9AGAR|nr:hypothetical protein BXZ70DRAFT_899027 [Cristinia sonorae]